VLASDAERDHVVTLLREAAVEGRLTLEEFTDRMGRAYLARTNDALDELIRDLPSVAAPRRRTRWLFALLSSARAGGGRARLGRRALCTALLGDVELDLRRATIEGDVTTIVVLAMLADVDVYVPEGVEVDLSGVAVLADKQVRGNEAPPRRGTPLVRVVAVAALADVTVWQVPLEWSNRATHEVARAIGKELEA